MKNKLLAMVVCLLLTILSSCLPETRPPIGVWKSESPNIILYVKPDYQRTPGQRSHYPGLYIIDDAERKIFVAILTASGFAIHEMYAIRSDGGLQGGYMLFAGTFRMSNETLRFTLFPETQSRTGYEEIIFHRLEYYDPINPEGWFPPIP